MSISPLTQTERGFDRIAFVDRYGSECSLQKSSIATEDCIWFGVNEVRPKVLATAHPQWVKPGAEVSGWVAVPIPDDSMVCARMHLTQEQVCELLPYLQRFAETGELS